MRALSFCLAAAACGEVTISDIAVPGDPAAGPGDAPPTPEPSVDGPVAGPEDPPPAPPAVYLNEVQTKNDSTVMDSALGFPDWVEIVNASGEAVDLSRLAVSLDDGAPAALGAGALAPGGLALFNGEYFGLYAVIETVDDTFLDRWYADGSGALYEGAYGVDFYLGDELEFECDEGPDPDDRADLTAVAEVLELEATDANVAALEALVDLDEFLAALAVEALIWHWDGYGRVFTFCLENPDCAARYDAALLAAADAMDGLDLAATMDGALALLAAEIAVDPRAEIDASTHASFVETMRYTIQTWPDEVRALVEAQ